ncbi:MAG TPA: DeoR/GlpR family DNA-binding transcription regulator [Acidimicrobiales bacterium]|nr:DeoR/GlpR family DNA-binding transcription regulator [Acidimicrobiales bacterium]
MPASSRLPARRRADLVKFVEEHGHATVSVLAEALDVSGDTVRRDLQYLDQQGVLVRSFGGVARRDELARFDPPFLARTRANSDAKAAIGRLAATLVSDRQTLIINGGTTTLALARALKGKKDLTVVTNNLHLPDNIPADAVSQLHILGGQFRMRSFATLGPIELPDAQGGRTHVFHADLAFIGVGGVSEEGGFTGGDLRESSAIRHMMERAERVVVLADSSKFGRTAFAHIGPLSVADVIITETAPSAAVRAALTESGVDLLVPEAIRDRSTGAQAPFSNNELSG